MKKTFFFKKISTFFKFSLLVSLPLFADLPHVDLDFSGLESLSKMGKKMTKATQHKTIENEDINAVKKTNNDEKSENKNEKEGD